MTSTRVSAAIAAALAAGALAACGSSSSKSSNAPAYGATAPATTPNTAAAPAGSAVALRADPTGQLRFNVSTVRAKAGQVTLRLTNPAGSGVPHGVAVQGNGVDKDSKIVRPGGTATVTAALKAGTYSFYCPVPGHEAAGMKGTLIVS